MKSQSLRRRGANGFILLEAMISILLFSVGVVGLVGLQAMSAKHATDAKYRTEAALLVNQLIGNMWVTDRNPSTLQTTFGTGGTGYNAWLASVRSTLPGVVPTTPTAPTVTVDATGVVTVAVYWQSPNEALPAVAHNLTTIAQVR